MACFLEDDTLFFLFAFILRQSATSILSSPPACKLPPSFPPVVLGRVGGMGVVVLPLPPYSARIPFSVTSLSTHAGWNTDALPSSLFLQSAAVASAFQSKEQEAKLSFFTLAT